VLGTTLADIITTPGVIDVLTTKADAGCQINILIAHPKSIWVTTLAQQLGQDHPDDDGNTPLDHELNRSHRLLTRLAEHPQIDIRTHWAEHANSILRFDDHMLVTLHLHHHAATDSRSCTSNATPTPACSTGSPPTSTRSPNTPATRSKPTPTSTSSRPASLPPPANSSEGSRPMARPQQQAKPAVTATTHDLIDIICGCLARCAAPQAAAKLSAARPHRRLPRAAHSTVGAYRVNPLPSPGDSESPSANLVDPW
jgi:hypothetical protein